MSSIATSQADLGQTFILSRLNVAEHTDATLKSGVLTTMYSDNSTELHPFIHFEPGCYTEAQKKLKGALSRYSVRVEESVPHYLQEPFPGTEFLPPRALPPPPAGPGLPPPPPGPPPPGVGVWPRETSAGRIAQSLWSERNLLHSKLDEFSWSTENGADDEDGVASQALRTLMASFDTATENLKTAIALAGERDQKCIRGLFPIPNG